MPSSPIRRTVIAIAGPLGWVAGFSFFLNLIYLAAPLYMMQVYDRVMHSRSVPTLVYLTLIVALCYVVYAVLDGCGAGCCPASATSSRIGWAGPCCGA